MGSALGSGAVGGQRRPNYAPVADERALNLGDPRFVRGGLCWANQRQWLSAGCGGPRISAISTWHIKSDANRRVCIARRKLPTEVGIISALTTM